MAVISITITQSEEQVVAGIPKIVSITTNIPATIFYTLDGSTPTLFSTIYTSPIYLPYNQLSTTLSILASNGIDSSAIIVETYMTNIVDSNVRLPHSGTTARANHIHPDDYPFGTPPFEPKQQFTNPADAGPYNGAVYNPALPAISNGFDGQGNPNNFTNQPYNSSNYQIIYSDRDAEGNPSIGNFPGKVTNPYPSDIQPDKGQSSTQGPEQTSQFTTLFDPRASVIFQDFSKEDPSQPPIINRQYFSLENPERARDGTFFYNTAHDSTAPPSGSFIKAYYNPRKNTITHYYRDSWANRWIISESPYVPNGSYDGNLAQMAIGGNGKVFEWINFQRRVLF